MNASPLDLLLQRLSSGQVHTLSGLAAELEVGQELLEQMLEQLARAGYLAVTQADCAAGRCEKCAAHDAGCTLLHGGRIWTVTDKGLRALGMHRRDAEGAEKRE